MSCFSSEKRNTQLSQQNIAEKSKHVYSIWKLKPIKITQLKKIAICQQALTGQINKPFEPK